MAWELRGGRMYYYRSRKRLGRVVKEYLGAGELGALAAQVDVAQRADRAELAEQERLKRARLDAISESLDDGLTMLLRRATMLLGSLGFHKHRGEWRRQRR